MFPLLLMDEYLLVEVNAGDITQVGDGVLLVEAYLGGVLLARAVAADWFHHLWLV